MTVEAGAVCEVVVFFTPHAWARATRVHFAAVPRVGETLTVREPETHEGGPTIHVYAVQALLQEVDH